MMGRADVPWTVQECIADDCTAERAARGYCAKHYTRLIRNGTTRTNAELRAWLESEELRELIGDIIAARLNRTADNHDDVAAHIQGVLL